MAIYIIGYGPYFLFTPLPEFQQDAYIYFWGASLIRDGIIPLPKFIIDVPVGYPFFIWAIKSLFSTTGVVVIAQNVVFVAVSLYCIFCFSQLKKGFGWMAAIALAIFAIDNFSIRMNTSLYTESLYSSTLIFIGGRIALLFRNFNTSNIISLTLSLLLPGLLRPNGIFIFILIPIIGAFILISKRGLSDIRVLLFSFVAVLLLWSSINYVFKGLFLPSDPYRLALVYDRMLKKEVKKPISDEKNLSYKKPVQSPSRLQLLYQNATAFSQLNPSFYFTYLPDRFKMIYVDDMYHDPQQKLFNRLLVDTAAPGLKKYMLGEFVSDQKNFSQIETSCNLQSAHRNKWMFLNHLFYKIHGYIFRNYIWVFLFYFIGILFIMKIIRGKVQDTNSWLIITLFLMHLVSIIIIAFGHDRFQTRYAHASEMFFLLTLFVGFYSLFGQQKEKAF
ncbi:MAG: hypothetical protein IPP77_12265 [Bacteroidetes bacterium]|nr:hypothetical protein [Bacteroidota bacterium]